MKPLTIILLTLLLVGCSGTHQNATLTADQARTVAIQLANDKASTLYHSQPFQDGQPAQFVKGRWIWIGRRGLGQGDIQATVNLAADGSTNYVNLELSDTRMILQ